MSEYFPIHHSMLDIHRGTNIHFAYTSSWKTFCGMQHAKKFIEFAFKDCGLDEIGFGSAMSKEAPPYIGTGMVKWFSSTLYWQLHSESQIIDMIRVSMKPISTFNTLWFQCREDGEKFTEALEPLLVLKLLKDPPIPEPWNMLI